MNEQTAAIVQGFKRLSPEDKTTAYIEIEEDWKGPRQEEPPDPTSSRPGPVFR